MATQPCSLLRAIVATLAVVTAASSSLPAQAPAVATTREFSVHGGEARLGAQSIRLWGIACGDALKSRRHTERVVNALDDFASHGVNLVSVQLQSERVLGERRARIGRDAIDRAGRFDADAGDRLEWLVREADARDMVVLIHVLSTSGTFRMEPAAVRDAFAATAALLHERGLRNVLVDGAHRDGDEQAVAWFRAIAPSIEVSGADVVVTRDAAAAVDDPYLGFVVHTATGDPSVCGARHLAHPHAALVWDARASNDRDSEVALDAAGVHEYLSWLRAHVGPWRQAEARDVSGPTITKHPATPSFLDRAAASPAGRR